MGKGWMGRRLDVKKDGWEVGWMGGAMDGGRIDWMKGGTIEGNE